MNTRLNIDSELLENIQIAQSDNWHFLVKLMYMIRSKQITTDMPNMDIYKRVIGAIAQDNMATLDAKREVYEELIKSVTN